MKKDLGNIETDMGRMFNELLDKEYSNLGRNKFRFSFIPGIGQVSLYDGLNANEDSGVAHRLKLFVPLELFDFSENKSSLGNGLIARGLSAISVGCTKDTLFINQGFGSNFLFETEIDKDVIERASAYDCGATSQRDLKADLIETKRAWESYARETMLGKVRGYTSRQLERKFS